MRIALAITDTDAWRGRELVVRSDSMYAIGAVTAPQGPEPHHKNARLIVIVRRMLLGRVVTFEHVEGHAGVEGNERADVLAGLARKRAPKAADRSAA